MLHQTTRRLYWEDDHLFEADAIVVAVHDDAIAFDQSPFFPGGGGQPPDEGQVRLGEGKTLDIVTTHADADDIIWHVCSTPPPTDSVGQPARLMLNRARRLALMRYHTVLHVVNTIALRDYNGWITGVQIGVDYSRIDFKWDGFTPAVCAALEQKVNTVLAEDHALKAYYIAEAEFRQRADLLRTLEAQPPIRNGQIRVVEIVGFDAQACGGTHVRTTADVGEFSIYRTDNKGKINKRLYVHLGEPKGLRDL